jgi:lysyl-tRNA synthetase class 1
LSQVKDIPSKSEKLFLPRFRDIANYLSQGLSEKEVLGKFENSDVKIMQERIKYAKVWLTDYAPEEYIFEMTGDIPESVRKLTSEQKKYLGKVAELFEKDVEADSLQVELYNLSKELKIKPSDAFAAIYLAFLGKTHGPRAGVLLTNFGKEKVTGRISSIMKEGDLNG